LADALTRKGASEIMAIVPWLGYSKQDKVFLPGESLAAKVVAQILQSTRIKKLVTFDLHNRAITGFFDIPVIELSAKPLFLEYFQQRFKIQDSRFKNDVVVVAPDEGAVKASGAFARELGVPVVYLDKRRDLTTGAVTVSGMSGDVEGKEAIIVDDMIVTGSTAMKTASYLKTKGAARVTMAATHHLYVPGVQEKLEASELDEIVVTDTVCGMCTNKQMHTNVHHWEKLRVLSVAETIVDELA
jgi:ribose-phosphate pyrophosphokinase